ncbi:alpha/beta fold hydrolase [Variovorax sp. RA8]|uniref:alpha/beta fold hydrolase n=1 Tax=Variovorax sp. (strain JCM 16519 / RA8) TaxID=662548 RepID=UPI001317BDF3|nr:alpha/beta hydrolase [Variovorax sp. RA8]VTU31886.1 Haloacetate dehalogenase H-1 [Variovorax sp. RA8]
MAAMTPVRQVRAGVLDIGYHESGPADGPPVLLVHGFPYDIHAYAGVAPLLAAKGCRVIVPFMRGYGSTRFLDAATPRSGQQGAFGADLLALMDALAIPRAVLAGYDWGGRACCVVAALWPERCAGLVSLNSYNIQDIAAASKPAVPENERRHWYQYYFHGERGHAGLEQNRRPLCRLLWSLWSPTWVFDDATFERSAAAFDHPDFVEVVIHSYRHRFGLVPGDPAYDEIEHRLAAQPPITVPAITFDGADDGVMSIGGTAAHARHFTGPHQHRVVPGAGHNLPQEKPQDFADAILELVNASRP